MFLAAGADIEAVDDDGNTPLANAFVNCFADPFPIVELLLDGSSGTLPACRRDRGEIAARAGRS